ncbi:MULTISPECIES: hypothetical protein [Pseudofrankia]|uniref:hypothetical protein n=1 Tax=Pseudofrankia TaxID=2994363 RepID=UPI000234B9DA|nr:MULTISPECIES: hypothetical protein [Pseudofrankia]OHV30060.1 hypothetical protein BCD49_34855 [Pseudofrankia sp. EUN1h]
MALVSVVPAVLVAHAHQLAALAASVNRAIVTQRDGLTGLYEQTEERVRATSQDLTRAENAVRAAERALERAREEEERAACALREAEAAVGQANEGATAGVEGVDTEAALQAERRAAKALDVAGRKVEEAEAELERARAERTVTVRLRENALALRGRAREQVDRGRTFSTCATRFGDLAADAIFLLAELLDLLDVYLADVPGQAASATSLRQPAFMAQIAGAPARHGLRTFAGEGAGVGGVADLLGDLLAGLDVGTADLEKGWNDSVGRRYQENHLAPMIGGLREAVTMAFDIQAAVHWILGGLANQGGGL